MAGSSAAGRGPRLFRIGENLNVRGFRKNKDPAVLAECAVLAVFLAWFFYRSPAALLITVPLMIPYGRKLESEKKKKRKEKLTEEFKEALGSMITAMKAGYSAENAIRETYLEMVFLYGEGSAICEELYRIQQGLDNCLPLEELMTEFGERSGSEDIAEFAEIFSVAKRSGGNMAEIMGRTISLLQDRMTVEKEIRVLISARRIEQKIMDVVPFFIVLYIGVTSRDFFSPLYHNLTGVGVMSVCLAVYLCAYRWSEKIMDIEV